MKIIELTGDLTIAINNDEDALLEKISGGPVPKGQLTEHEQHIAHNLTVKGILLRYSDNGKLYYKRPN